MAGDDIRTHALRAHDHSAAYEAASLAPSGLVLPGATSPSQTAEGSVVWDTDDDELTIGDGSSRQVFVPQNVGTWTPTISAATPGDLSVAYSGQDGHYTQIGRVIIVAWDIKTSSFTHTTASGDFLLGGLPFAAGGGNVEGWGPIAAQGWSDSNVAWLVGFVFNGSSNVRLQRSRDNAASSTLPITTFPTGGTVKVWGSLTYIV